MVRSRRGGSSGRDRTKTGKSLRKERQNKEEEPGQLPCGLLVELGQKILQHHKVQKLSLPPWRLATMVTRKEHFSLGR